MAGTSWDKLGQVEAAFEAVGPAIREAAKEGGARLREFHNEDPIWRLVAGENYVDVIWDESKPDVFTVRAIRWVDDRPQYDQVGEFARDRDAGELKALIAEGLARVKS
ncbi:MAG TPA: hypothetical protein VF137_07105 [Candidatus Dormibacteraeota bacterium]